MSYPKPNLLSLKQELVIDSHAHLGWGGCFYVPDPSVQRLVRFMDSLGMDRVVCAHLGAIEWDPEYGHAEMERAIQESEGRLCGYLIYNPHYPEEYLASIKKYLGKPGFVGIKIHPAWHRCPPGAQGYWPIWDFARDTGLPVLSHTWDYDPDNPKQDLSVPQLFREVAVKYPKVKILLGHSGGRYNGHVAAVELAQECPNIYLDLAGDSFLLGLIEYFVGQGLADRLLFASDLTWIDPRPNLGSILYARISDDDKRKILGLNAKGIFGLETR